MQKTYIYLVFSALFLNITPILAQSLPKINTKDYGFTTNTKKVEITTYSVVNNSIILRETNSYKFNDLGNIQTYKKREKHNSSWIKSKNIYVKGLLRKKSWKHSNSSFNKKHLYTYDNKTRLINEHIRSKNGNTNHIKFKYQNNLLHKITTNDNDLEITYYYTQKRQLFKKVYSEKKNGKPNIITNHFYLENKEIFSYEEPKNHYKAHIYNENVYIGFELINEKQVKSKIDKGIQRFNEEAPKDNLPFNLEQHCNQTWQFYNKNLDKVIPFEIKFYRYTKDVSGNKIKYAEAVVNIKTKTISSISFYKTTLKNNNVIGSTEFDKKVFSEFKEDINFINIP